MPNFTRAVIYGSLCSNRRYACFYLAVCVASSGGGASGTFGRSHNNVLRVAGYLCNIVEVKGAWGDVVTVEGLRVVRRLVRHILFLHRSNLNGWFPTFISLLWFSAAHVAPLVVRSCFASIVLRYAALSAFNQLID